MNRVKWDNWWTATVIIVAAWTIGWGTTLPKIDQAWTVRVGLLTAGTVLVFGLMKLWFARQESQWNAADRYLTALCRVDLRDLRHGDHNSSLPALPSTEPWRGLTLQIHDGLCQQSRRVQDLEQARAVSELRACRATAQLEQIRAVLSKLAEPVLVINNFNELALANTSAEQLFHLEPGAAEGKAAGSVLHCQKLLELVMGAARHKTAGCRHDEIELTDAEGNARWFRATASRVRAAADDEEGSGGTVLVLQDIADRRTLQKRNAEFVSAVSHEMKAPLAGIKAYVELLADGEAEDQQTRDDFLGVIDGQAERLQRLVENLLNLARIEAGVVQVSKEPQSLNALLEEALHVVQPAADAKTIALLGDLSPLYLGVLADRDMLMQAAINLLSNAVKYTPPGGQVTLRSRLESGQVRFEVQDTGVGLSESDCSRVFEKFYRASNSREMASGTGLGLPLAKHVIEDVHGGRLWVESTVGKGSTFAVALPSAGQVVGESR
jgi:two-component system, OmpR family, phosphate regulon sensor histidine kinase PhoR